MEGMYAIFTSPQPLTEAGPIGFVLAGSLYEAQRRAASVVKLGTWIHVVAL